MELGPLASRLRPVPPAYGAAGGMAAAVALVVAGPEGEVLLIRRHRRRGDPWSGQLALPGGRRAPGDAGPLATAVREVSEEVGLDLGGERPLGCLDPLAPANRPRLLVLPIVFALGAPAPLAPGPEVAAAAWVPLADLAARRGRASVPTPSGPREVPCFSLPLGTLWGLTYRILDAFLALAGPPGA